MQSRAIADRTDGPPSFALICQPFPSNVILPSVSAKEQSHLKEERATRTVWPQKRAGEEGETSDQQRWRSCAKPSNVIGTGRAATPLISAKGYVRHGTSRETRTSNVQLTFDPGTTPPTPSPPVTMLIRSTFSLPFSRRRPTPPDAGPLDDGKELVLMEGNWGGAGRTGVVEAVPSFGGCHGRKTGSRGVGTL